MSLLSLILGDKKFRTEIGILTLDAAISVNHTLRATPTKNPIESKSGVAADNFTDHVRLENRMLTIEGFISEAPLSNLGSAFNVFTGAATSYVSSRVPNAVQGFAAQAFATGLGTVSGMIANRLPGDLTYPTRAYEYLVELWRNRIPFLVHTRMQLYWDMIITDLSVPQEAADGRSLRFNATFEQIEIVKTSTVKIPESIVKNASAADKVPIGNLPNNSASADNASLVKSGLNALNLTTRGSGLQ